VRKVKAVHMIDAGGSREDMHECVVKISSSEPYGAGSFGPVEAAVADAHGVSRSKVTLLKWSE
jgi:hypothetical protein